MERIYGLVLTGGRSQRMGRDKALIPYHGIPQARFARELLGEICREAFLSARSAQWVGTPLEREPTITDDAGCEGPIAGILSAFARHPEAYWLVVACDLPGLSLEAAAKLVRNLDPASAATCYTAPGGQPEPLCAIYSPLARPALASAASAGRGPIHVLRTLPCRLVAPDPGVDLAGANTPEEAAASCRRGSLSMATGPGEA